MLGSGVLTEPLTIESPVHELHATKDVVPEGADRPRVNP